MYHFFGIDVEYCNHSMKLRGVSAAQYYTCTYHGTRVPYHGTIGMVPGTHRLLLLILIRNIAIWAIAR